LGIVMTPTVIALMIGSSTSTSGGASITWNQFCKMLVSLGSSVFLPVVLGQLARLVPIFRSTMRKHMQAETLFSDIIL
jgi:predicted Na+-dependent transporter